MADEGITDEITAPVVSGEHSRHVPQPLSVRRNFVWSLAGNVLYAVCQWGVLIVLAKLCSSETLGLYLLGVTVTSPIFLFAGMQLRRLQATDSREEFQFGHYLALQLLACAVGMLASWGWSAWGGHVAATLAVVLLVALNKALETLSTTFYGLFQQRERMDRISISRTLQGMSTTAGLCGGIVLTGDIVWAVGLSAVARLLVVLLYDVSSTLWLLGDAPALSSSLSSPMHERGKKASASGLRVKQVWTRVGAGLRRCRPLWQWRPLKQLAVMGIPLGVTGMLVSLNTNLPRGFVESERGVAALGIFGALCTPLVVMNTFTQAMELSASARLAKVFAAGDLRGFRKLTGLMMATNTAVSLVGIVIAHLFGRELLTLLFTAEYAQHVDVFVTIMWATLAATSTGVMATALIAARHIQIQMPLTGLTSLTALTACYWLVPALGIQGAAISLTVSKLPYLAVGTWLLARAKPDTQNTQAASQQPDGGETKLRRAA